MLASSNAWAQRYPSKPIRYLVADAAGSGAGEIDRRAREAGKGDQPDQFSAHLKAETERLGAVIRKLGLKSE